MLSRQLLRISGAFLLGLTSAAIYAQDYYGQPQQAPAYSKPSPYGQSQPPSYGRQPQPAPHGQIDDSWIPRNVEVIGRNAAFHTDFTFDRTMLALANNFIDDEETRRVVAKLRGISVHCYKFSMPGLYDPAGLDAVRQQYHTDGWKHLVTSRSIHDPDNLGRTDVWIRFEHTNVEGAVVMLASPTSINLIAVNGTLSPLDLLHLRGHFGIPKFSGDHLVEQNN